MTSGTETPEDAEYERLLRLAAGVDARKWAELDSPARAYVLAQGRILLVRAARVSRGTWNAMPARGPERAAVLLRGAEVLRIDTAWAGWAAGGAEMPLDG